MGNDYLDSYEDYIYSRGRASTPAHRPSGQSILKTKPKVKAVYKTTHEIDASEMEFLPAPTFETMMRNTVRANDEFSDEDLEWCRDNCTDLWTHNDVNLIRFLNKEDLTLFMVARS